MVLISCWFELDPLSESGVDKLLVSGVDKLLV